MPRNDFLNSFLDQLAAVLVQRVTDYLNGSVPIPKRAGRYRGPSPLKGKHFSAAKMRCRYPGCKNRSKGPKFSFLCEKHLKLPKREVRAALEKAKNAA
jgi:hypothetical protein